MLFVSKRLGSCDYAVFDTDDGVEEVINYDGLNSVIGEYGIDISGVHVHRIDKPGAGQWDFWIDKISVFQPAETLSKEQLKLKMLLNVTMSMFGDCITGILWDAWQIIDPVTIRLSDYGKSCSSRLLSGNETACCHVVTIVLDDKIKLDPDAFVLEPADLGMIENLGRKSYGVVLDLREMTDLEAVRSVYWAVYSTGFLFDWGTLSDSVIDLPERKFGMLAWLDTRQEDALEEEAYSEE